MQKFNIDNSCKELPKEVLSKLGFTFERETAAGILENVQLPGGWKVLDDGPLNSLVDETGRNRGALYKHMSKYGLDLHLHPRFGVHETQNGVICFGQCVERITKGTSRHDRPWLYENLYTPIYIAGTVEKLYKENDEEGRQLVQQGARQIITDILMAQALAWGKANFPGFESVTAYQDLDINKLEVTEIPPKPTWQTNIETGLLQRAIELQKQAAKAIKATGFGKTKPVEQLINQNP